MNLDDLRYPIRRFAAPDTITPAHVQEWIADIARLPADLRSTVEPLTAAQLDTPYRPGGWTVRQVVHHLADSHMNSVIRFKWALTEDRPTIKAYYEDRWAELADYTAVPVATTLAFLDALHARWVGLLRALDPTALKREFIHPESGAAIRLERNLGIYAWHGRHHRAHITRLAEREGWRS